jgi:hypothetical protein
MFRSRLFLAEKKRWSGSTSRATVGSLRSHRFFCLVLGVIGSGCSYQPSFGDCEITCTTTCPADLKCSGGFCRVLAATAPCSEVLGDAGLHDDGGDGGEDVVVLRQTADDNIQSGNTPTCRNTDNTTADNKYFRVFSLAEAGVTGGFHITEIDWALDETQQDVDVVVAIGTYTGGLDGATINSALITPINSVSAPIKLSLQRHIETVPLTANIPAGSDVIVTLQVPDLLGTTNSFFMGSTTSSETHPGYMQSAKCNTAPKTTTAAGFPDSRLIITASGTRM